MREAACTRARLIRALHEQSKCSEMGHVSAPPSHMTDASQDHHPHYPVHTMIIPVAK